MPLVPYKIVITIIYYLHLHLFHCFDYITKTENQKTFDHKFLLHLHLFLRFMCFGYSLTILASSVSRWNMALTSLSSTEPRPGPSSDSLLLCRV